MNNNCILKELKHSIHLQVRLLFVLPAMCIFAGLITASTQVDAAALPFENGNTTEEKSKQKSKSISDKLFMADIYMYFAVSYACFFFQHEFSAQQ